MPPGAAVCLLVNPRAGRGQAAEVAGLVAMALRSRGISVTVPPCGSAAAVRAAAAEAVRRGDRGVVVVGGDGMCHLVIQEIAGTAAALGVVPAGTGNDFALALGLPADVQAAATALADTLECEQLRHVDLGRSGQRWWASVLCAGFDSAVNDRANRMRWPHGPRRYDLALLAELARLRAIPLTVELDDKEVSLEATLVAVGNTSTYGGGIRICPDADPQDGLLDVTVVGRLSRRQLIRATPTLRHGRHLAHPAVRSFRVRTVSVYSDAKPVVSAYADGEPIQVLPVTATCQPGALRVLQNRRQPP